MPEFSEPLCRTDWSTPIYALKCHSHNFSCIFLNVAFCPHRNSFHFRLRVFIHWIVTKKVFDWFIMLVIVLSSIALASEDPVDEDSPRNEILGLADYGFTAIFTLECSLKVREGGQTTTPINTALN